MLKRRFTAFHLLLLSVNGMVGSAWLFAPLYAARLAGPSVIWAWVLCGLATCLIALTFAELSCFLPLPGGTSKFAQLSHGAVTGFVISWIAWLSCVTMAPIEVQAVLQYASTYFPSLMALHGAIPQLTAYGWVWAFVLMLGMVYLNIKSFKGLIGFNFALFTFKVLVIIFTITWFIHTRFLPGNFAGGNALGSADTWKGILSAMAMGGIAFAFTGFKHGVELAGESKNTQRTIPIAIVGSVLLCLILYVGLQVAFIGALNPSDIANGWHTLSFAGDLGPFVGIALILGITWLVKLLYIDAAVSPLGAGLIYSTSTARIIYAMSQQGYLPTILSKTNKESMPMGAIWFNFIVGMFLFLPLPGWQTMVSFLVSAVVISYAMGPIVLMCLRKSLPDAKRPFRLPFASILCPVAFYFCNLLSYWTGWNTMKNLTAAVAVGLVILIIALIRKRLNTALLNLKAIWWVVPYLLGLGLISYLGSFGGKNIIPFGWDFLVIAIFTMVIYVLALATRSPHIKEQAEVLRQTLSAD